uniref:PIR Superfamily Protein n=1 Tax=Strongyloides venezuelensis TaxID=75913 RepID=A0A0K0FHI1_STRVS
MLFVASVLRDLITKNTENAGQYSNLRKNYIFEGPKYPYRDINILENLSGDKSFVNNMKTLYENKCNKLVIYNNEVIKKIKNDKLEEENEMNDEDDCGSKGTGTYIDDNIWDKLRRSVSSISTTSSCNKSYLYKWQPRFLETSISLSSLEKISSTNSSIEGHRRRKRRFYKKYYSEVESISSEDLDSMSFSSRHSIKIKKGVIGKVVSKYNLIYGNNFNINDEYIDDTYDDEGCFTHLEFHIFK